ncbi:hypothetical protein EAF04_004424 [Stromatinia cepivora]|nr:hypothetical protein EAF04_004424 [Stromatinia cepivora]
MIFQQFSTIGLTAAVILTAICYVTALSVYRLFLHPLVKFPGPKLAVLTKWYEFYFDLMKAMLANLPGSIVRINPEEAQVQDPDWYDTLYASNPTKRDKYPPAANIAGVPLGTFGTVEHDIHRKRRAANSQLQSTRAVYDAQPLIVDQTSALRCWPSPQIPSQDMRSGRSSNLQENEKLAVDWNATIRAVDRVTLLMKQFPWMMTAALYIPITILRLFMPELSKLVQYHADTQSFADRFISQQQMDQKEPKSRENPSNMTLLQCISQNNLPAHEKEAKRLAHEAIVVISAAAETTSRTLSIAMFYILSHPQVLRRLQDEIKLAMPDTLLSYAYYTSEMLPMKVAPRNMICQ